MPKTIKSVTISDAVKLAKPFAAKKDTRPVLTVALVTESHVIATDSHRLIRIKHGESVTENRLEHFKKASEDYTARNYPETSRLIPDPSGASQSFKIDLAQWIEIHTGALVVAKANNKWLGINNNVIHIRENKFQVDQVHTYKVKEAVKKGKKTEYVTKEMPVPGFEQVYYTYNSVYATGIEEVAYNCEYMLTALKVFKKLKEEPTFYFFGKHRPMLLKSENCEVLILPVRIIQ